MENLTLLTRRTFLQTAALAAAPQNRPLRLAVLASVYRPQSDAQHLADHFLVGYPYAGAWRNPNVKVASLYVAQKPADDLSGARAREFDFRIYPTIPEALRGGGKELAVDAVLAVADPGADFLRETAGVLAADRRTVPVFYYGTLPGTIKSRPQFPLLAGGFLPVTWRLPSIDVPLDAEIQEAIVITGKSSGSMDFHALEALQCMVERRRGGETGVRSVQLIEGDAVWKAGEEGHWSKELLEAALSRSDLLLGKTVEDSRPQDMVHSGVLPHIVPKPAAYFIERRDGLRSTLLMLNGAVADYTFACRLRNVPHPLSTQFFLTPTPNVTYSACLAANIEEMFATGQAPYPVERTLIVSGILESCLDSKQQGNRRLNTPHLDVTYQPPKQSHFCRA